MKALLLDQFSDCGGAQQCLLDLLPELRDRGWDAVVALPGNGPLFDLVRDEGFPAVRIDCGLYASGRKTAADVARFVSGTPRLAGQIQSLAQDADLVYINGPRLLPAAALARPAPPVVFHAHSFLPPGLLRRIAGAALRRLNARVLANCEFVAATLRPFAPTQVIYNGVAGPLEAPSSTAGNVVACIGRIAPEKGQREFLEAARAAHAIAPDLRFVIYGAPLFGDAAAARYYHDLRERSRGLPVHFAGWVTDVFSALSGVDVLAVPSKPTEATTRVILEAYAAGVPVVAFRSGGIPEILEDGRTGLLVNDTAEMTPAIVSLIRDPERRWSMSAAAREYWERRFTLERYRNEVAEALETARRR